MVLVFLRDVLKAVRNPVVTIDEVLEVFGGSSVRHFWCSMWRF